MEPRLADLLGRVVRYWHHTLLNSPAAREWLWGLVLDAGQVCGGGKLDAGLPPIQPPASQDQPPDQRPGPRPASHPGGHGVPPLPPPDAADIERHTLGYADGTLHQLIPPQGEIVEQLRLLGILDKPFDSLGGASLAQGRERFVGHIAMPVFDERDCVVQVAFYAAGGGRGRDIDGIKESGRHRRAAPPGTARRRSG